MIVTRKTLSRRAMLRGVGATLALPWLDAMTPALAAKPAQTPLRLGFVYVPNGAIMDRWTPAAEGAGFEYPSILQALEPFREQVAVVSGLAQLNGRALGDGPGDHGRAGATFLTGVHPRKTEGRDLHAGISADQVAARQLGAATQLASLEIGLEAPALVGGCDSGYSCAYTNTICWRDPATPLPMETSPRALFERLFGDEDDAAVRRKRAREDASVLDFVSQDLARLERGLGPADRGKLDQYLDAVRDVERRIQNSEKRAARRRFPMPERPSATPAAFEDYARLMIDLQTIAFQADLTRVITLMIGHEASERVYGSIGLAEGHHTLTHHRGDPEKIDSVARINALHVSMFGYMLEKLRSTRDGGGSLLDHTILLYGSSLSDGNTHRHDNLPIVMAGGPVLGGRHVRYAANTPMTNLLLSMLGRAGVRAERLGDSTGALPGLFAS